MNVLKSSFLKPVLAFVVLSSAAGLAQCPEVNLEQKTFSFPSPQTECITFSINEPASRLRGELTAKERSEHEADRAFWVQLALPESSVAPSRSDIALYPASGVDIGLVLNVFRNAGLYITVDRESTFAEEEVIEWGKSSRFDVRDLFRQRTYTKTIPMMMTGAAGHGADFAKSFLRNLIVSLPDDAHVDRLTVIFDRQGMHWKGKPIESGPHLLVEWRTKSRSQSALLISAPMLAPSEGKGIWWYDELSRLKPGYAVMKRPQGFSFDEVYAECCSWAGSHHGMLLMESKGGNVGIEAKTQTCLDELKAIVHHTNGRFGFSDGVVLWEVLGTKGK